MHIKQKYATQIAYYYNHLCNSFSNSTIYLKVRVIE